MFTNKQIANRLAASVVVAAVLALSLTAGASAQAIDPTGEQYNSTLTQLSAGVDPPSGDSPSGGSLPFTGLDIAGMALAALVLAGAGLAMKRRHTTLSSNTSAR